MDFGNAVSGDVLSQVLKNLAFQHVKATWGKRCDVLYFVSTVENASLPSIAMKGVNESREILWGKTRQYLRHKYLCAQLENEYTDVRVPLSMV